MTFDQLPNIGLGTYSDNPTESRADAVTTALSVGYRHIDTAQVYKNETYVGSGIARSSVPRENVFLATKTVHNDVPDEGEEALRHAVNGSLDRLGVDYLDMLYVHWPVGNYDPNETLAVYDDLYETGIIDHIGLSNFTPELLDEAHEMLASPIFAHQVEMHPLLQQEELHAYAERHGHTLVAYSPLAKGKVFNIPELTEVAEKHNTTEAAVAIAWLIDKDVIPIPKATSAEHILANYKAASLSLDKEDHTTIASIDQEHRVIDYDWAPWNQ